MSWVPLDIKASISYIARRATPPWKTYIYWKGGGGKHEIRTTHSQFTWFYRQDIRLRVFMMSFIRVFSFTRIKYQTNHPTNQSINITNPLHIFCPLPFQYCTKRTTYTFNTFGFGHNISANKRKPKEDQKGKRARIWRARMIVWGWFRLWFFPRIASQ